MWHGAVKIAVTRNRNGPKAAGKRRRRFALLVAVSEAVSLLSAVSHLSIFDVSHGVCESYGAADRPTDRPVRDR